MCEKTETFLKAYGSNFVCLIWKNIENAYRGVDKTRSVLRGLIHIPLFDGTFIRNL